MYDKYVNQNNKGCFLEVHNGLLNTITLECSIYLYEELIKALASLFCCLVVCGGRKRDNRQTDRQTDRHTQKHTYESSLVHMRAEG